MSHQEHPLLWSLRSIARLERKGDLRPPRLTEPGLKKWHRMRRKLGYTDLIAILHEDLADAFPYPFELGLWDPDPLADIDDESAHTLLELATIADSSSAQSFLRQAALALKLPASGNIAGLPKVQPHQSALEMPGSGGRIAAQQALEHGLSVQDRFTLVVNSDQERLCLGLALVEVRANPPTVWTLAEAKANLEAGAHFDHVFGVPHHPPAMDLAREARVEARWS